MDQAPDPIVNPDTSTPPPAAAPFETKKGPAYGTILGIILIVAILVAGAFYVWDERVSETNEILLENGVRGEVLPDGTIPTTEGSPSVRTGENGPEPI